MSHNCQQQEVLVPCSPRPWLLHLPALEHADPSWLKWAVSNHAVSKDNCATNIHSWLSFSCWAQVLRCLLMGPREGWQQPFESFTVESTVFLFLLFFLPDDSSNSSSSSFPQSWWIFMHLPVTNTAEKISIWYWILRSGLSQKSWRIHYLSLSRKSIITLYIYGHADALIPDK